jgi:hypothetical protein
MFSLADGCVKRGATLQSMTSSRFRRRDRDKQMLKTE